MVGCRVTLDEVPTTPRAMSVEPISRPDVVIADTCPTRTGNIRSTLKSIAQFASIAGQAVWNAVAKFPDGSVPKATDQWRNSTCRGSLVYEVGSIAPAPHVSIGAWLAASNHIGPVLRFCSRRPRTLPNL